MRMRMPSSSVLIWLVAGTIAAMSCSLYWQATYFHGEYLPVGNDSFYHARRILDTVANPGAFYEFDPRIHAPEGSLLVWPWGYDYLMAQVVRLGMAVGISSDPMAILIWIPVAAVFVSIALIVVVARRLSLSAWPTTLAALCVALAPTTQLLHGVGQIDHHYAEFIFVLATLAGGLTWFSRPDDARAAAILGAVLGLAPAIHNGSFILQLPVLFTLFAMWLQGRSLSRRATVFFCVTLLLTTLAVLLPSLPFRMGRFEFYTLSWFHLHIAVCTAAVAAFLGFLPMTRKRMLLLIGGCLVLALPILQQANLAHTFLSGTLARLNTIGEMQSPWRQLWQPGGTELVANMYSHLIWLAPLTLALCLVQCWRERGSDRLFFWIASVCGLVLLSMQLRMHYYGSFALFLPWLIVIQDYARAKQEIGKLALLLTSMALLLLYYPPLRHQLVMPMPRADDPTFELVQPVLVELRKSCAKDPGVVLADTNAGHYIRYFSDCSVIANNFLLTPQQLEKVAEVDRLFALRASELAAKAPFVKYVLVRPLAISRGADGAPEYRPFKGDSWQLASDLLLSKEPLPPGFKLLYEVRVGDPKLETVPYARLYRIDTPVSAAATSPNNARK